MCIGLNALWCYLLCDAPCNLRLVLVVRSALSKMPLMFMAFGMSFLFPQVAAALPLYCQHSVPAKKGAAHNKVITGAEALTEKLDALTKKGDLTFEDLTEVHVFQWLLTDEQKAQLKGLTDTLLATVQTGSKRKATKKASPPKSAKKVASDQNDLTEAMSLFG